MKKKRNSEKIIYSINIGDVQNVAEQELGRELTPKELKVIEDKIGDYFDWFDSISFAIAANIES
ncbi:MAG: hypothetical protein DWQ06_13835 [Calditrichaeota bacterium]|nr:MAG: hypothetical protein DWQ06_13835 [Calditrichota bacterium]